MAPFTSGGDWTAVHQGTSILSQFADATERLTQQPLSFRFEAPDGTLYPSQ